MDEDTRASTMMKYLETGKLNHTEFQRKCLEWAFEIWVEFVPRSFGPKPEMVVDHETMPAADRKKLSDEYYRDHKEILEYYSYRDHTWHKNKGHHDWLNDMLSHCKDQEEVDKVKGRMAQFKAKIAEQGAILGVAECIAKSIPGAEEARAMFGGRYE